MPWYGYFEDSILCHKCGWLDNDADDGDDCPGKCDGTMKMASELFPPEQFDDNGQLIPEE